MAYLICPSCGDLWEVHPVFDCGISWDKGYCDVCDIPGEEITERKLGDILYD